MKKVVDNINIELDDNIDNRLIKMTQNDVDGRVIYFDFCSIPKLVENLIIAKTEWWDTYEN